MPCPVCGGIAYLLGTLGRLAHFCCRSCGMQCHAPAEGLDMEECE